MLIIIGGLALAAGFILTGLSAKVVWWSAAFALMAIAVALTNYLPDTPEAQVQGDLLLGCGFLPGLILGRFWKIRPWKNRRSD